jgi:Holliday junction resolvase RusA-like endonuclease
MQCVVKYFAKEHPPLLQLSIHDAPHRRMHVATIQRYRDELKQACSVAGIPIPISEPIDLSVIFVNPSSPDLDNLLTALYQALDGKTLKGSSVLTDDGLVSKATVSKFYPGPPKK